MDVGEEALNSGEPASLTCTVLKGDLPISIKWLHNNKLIKDYDGITVTRPGKKIGVLIIESVQAIHAGTFTCLAQNAAGSAQYSVDIHVNGTILLGK